MDYRSEHSWQNFCRRIEALGGQVLEPTWRGYRKPHHIRCSLGHDSYPLPSNINQGYGICSKCVHLARGEQARLEFNERVTALGGQVLEPTWKGARSPHHVRCVNGHDCYPHPDDIQRGSGLCNICTGHDTDQARRAFYQTIQVIGGQVLEPTWKGARSPHHVRCVNGHDCYPRPDHTQEGIGICTTCAGRMHDVFYIVSDNLGNIKLGITSGDPRGRLRDHSYWGYRTILFTRSQLPEYMARATEIRILQDLWFEYGFRPIKGKEYFGPETREVVLKLANTYLSDEAIGS